jgi:hypothetical protein
MNSITIYRTQGADNLVVDSGGTLTVKEGGTLCMEPGSILCNSFPTPPTTLSACRIMRDTDITLTPDVAENIQFNTSIYDSSNMHSTTENNDRVYIPKDGLYNISFNARFIWEEGSAGLLTFSVYKNNGSNNTIFLQCGSTYTIGVKDHIANGTTTQEFEEGDYIYVEAYRGSIATGTLVIYSIAEYSPLLTVTYLGVTA